MAHETELKAFQNVVSHIINQGGVTLSPPNLRCIGKLTSANIGLLKLSLFVFVFVFIWKEVKHSCRFSDILHLYCRTEIMHPSYRLHQYWKWK